MDKHETLFGSFKGNERGRKIQSWGEDMLAALGLEGCVGVALSDKAESEAHECACLVAFITDEPMHFLNTARLRQEVVREALRSPTPFNVRVVNISPVSWSGLLTLAEMTSSFHEVFAQAEVLNDRDTSESSQEPEAGVDQDLRPPR
jgi:hypothetical protein